MWRCVALLAQRRPIDKDKCCFGRCIFNASFLTASAHHCGYGRNAVRQWDTMNGWILWEKKGKHQAVIFFQFLSHALASSWSSNLEVWRTDHGRLHRESTRVSVCDHMWSCVLNDVKWVWWFKIQVSSGFHRHSTSPRCTGPPWWKVQCTKRSIT